LGFLIDTEKNDCYINTRKKDRLVEECQKLISKKQATIREVARVLGLIVSSFSGVDYGQLFYREIEVEKIQALKLARGNFH
jgi:K+/H+ antiporter YhaU regulatory subunit KhtT